MPLLRVLAGPDGVDEFTRADLQLLEPSAGRHVGPTLRVLNLPEPFLGLRSCTIHPSLERAQQRAVEALESRGCQLEQVTVRDFPELAEAFDVWAVVLGDARLAAKDGMFANVIGYETTSCMWSLWELAKCIACGGTSGNHTLAAAALALVEPGVLLFPARNERLRRAGAALKVKLAKALAGNTVMLVAALPTPAPRHNENFMRFPSVCQTAAFNTLELPVTMVPMGLNADGLPLGVQVVGGEGADHLTVAVAMALQESGVAGWQPPRA